MKTKEDFMNKGEFEVAYCQRSDITIEEYHNEYNLITLKCNCEHKECEGWAAVINSPERIKHHNMFHSKT